MNTSDSPRRLTLAVLLALSLATPACGGCGPEPDPGADAGADADPGADGGRVDGDAGPFDLDAWCTQPWNDRVVLSERTRELTGVTTARYELDRAEDLVRVTLFDAQDEEVSSLVFIVGDPNLDIQPIVRVEAPGQDPIDFALAADVPADGGVSYVQTTVSQGGQAVLRFLARFDGADPVDSWIAVPDPGAPIPDSLVFEDAEERLYAYPVTGEGEFLALEAEGAGFQAWLEAAGIDAFVSQPHLEAAAAAMSDEVLAAILDHGLTCERVERTARAGLGDEGASCTRRQGLDSECKPFRDGVTTVIQTVGFIGSLLSLTAAAGLLDGSVQLARGLSDGYVFVNFITRASLSSLKLFTITVQGTKQLADWFSCRKSGDPQACTKGDPHLITFDGLSFDLQAAGEFVMIDSDAPGAPVVQARFEPIGADANCSDVSIATALAARFGDDVLSIEHTDDGFVRRVNGQVVDRWADAVTFAEDAALIEERGVAVMVWPDGSYVAANLRGRRIDIVYRLAERWRGKVRGLNGDFDGDWLDDLSASDGRDLLPGLTFEGLYTDYADSWRVTPETSLFTYADGESTETYTAPNFPLRPALSDLLELEPFKDALAQCEDADVRAEWIEACVLDVGCTGDSDFITAMERMGQRAAQLALLDAPPTLEGDAALLGAPPSVQDDDLVDPRRALVFMEAPRATLRRDLPVDLALPGTYASPGDLESNARITAGSVVRSYMIHLDPGESFSGARTARLTFTTPIAGVAVTTQRLAASDARAGASGTVYPRESARGLELGADTIAISPDGLSLEITWTADTELDQARVFVTAPPELEEGR
jgi:hypothetical protein